jgi:hypothetical protein
VSLRSFHLLFIAMSGLLAAFLAVWAVGEYRASHEVSQIVTAVVSLAGAGALAAYGVAFQRKTRRFS